MIPRRLARTRRSRQQRAHLVLAQRRHEGIGNLGGDEAGDRIGRRGSDAGVSLGRQRRPRPRQTRHWQRRAGRRSDDQGLGLSHGQPGPPCRIARRVLSMARPGVASDAQRASGPTRPRGPRLARSSRAASRVTSGRSRSTSGRSRAPAAPPASGSRPPHVPRPAGSGLAGPVKGPRRPESSPSVSSYRATTQSDRTLAATSGLHQNQVPGESIRARLIPVRYKRGRANSPRLLFASDPRT